MRKSCFFFLGLAVAIFLGALWWRRESRRRNLPCPSWLAWLLENPLMDTFAGTQETLDRIGLQPGEFVLDVGSGPGRIAVPAARRVGSSGRVIALDLQPAMLQRLSARAVQAGVENIELRLGDVAAGMDLEADRYDRAWLVTVLGEIPDRAAAIKNIHRALKPGGTLSITEILPDPHYQPHRKVLQLGQEAGFLPDRYWGTFLSYTQNFVKDAK
jgi:ubiquinone/menaquinone biosynthesis C-methylase UbiE